MSVSCATRERQGFHRYQRLTGTVRPTCFARGRCLDPKAVGRGVSPSRKGSVIFQFQVSSLTCPSDRRLRLRCDAGLIMEMGDGECEAVSGIVLGFFGKTEKGLDHFLDLRFFSGAPAGGGHLDAAGFIFENRDAHACALRDHHATRVGEDHHGLDILGKEDAFDRSGVGMIFNDKLGEFVL